MPDINSHIKSYVIRKARMSESQKKAYAEFASDWLIPFSKKELSWKEIFPFECECRVNVIEIGFGMGDATLVSAKNNPEWCILGVEVHKPGIGRLFRLINENSIKNIRVIEHDAVDVLKYMIPENSTDLFNIWFPDPWPKKRHYKRRLIQIPFVHQLVKRLKPGGRIHIATDWQPYAEHIQNVFDSITGVIRINTDKMDLQLIRPETKFEFRGKSEKRIITDLIYEKEKIND